MGVVATLEGAAGVMVVVGKAAEAQTKTKTDVGEGHGS